MDTRSPSVHQTKTQEPMPRSAKEVVVVTGASAGVGRATVRAFARRGASIGLLARGREGLEAARQEVESLGGWKFANVKDGNLAEYFHVNDAQANLAPIPPGLSDEQACYCADMLSTGFMGAEYARIPIGGTVAVFAQGLVGLMATVGRRSWERGR